MSPYPPGVHSGTPNAPWNDPPAPECPECLATIHDVDDHEDYCEYQADAQTIHEHNAEEPATFEDY